jgi:hypothetical protein
VGRWGRTRWGQTLAASSQLTLFSREQAPGQAQTTQARTCDAGAHKQGRDWPQQEAEPRPEHRRHCWPHAAAGGGAPWRGSQLLLRVALQQRAGGDERHHAAGQQARHYQHHANLKSPKA